MHPSIEVTLRQIYFTGVQAVWIVTISGLLIGLIIVLQIASIVGTGSSNAIAKILLWLVLREIGPFFTGVIILTRSGSAISTELSTMKLGREIEYLEAMGIKPEQYLIKPRLIGVTFSSVVLSIYFELAALLGGVFLAALLGNIPFSEYADAIVSYISFKEVIYSLSKSFIFGFVISIICIFQGLSVKKVQQKYLSVQQKLLQEVFFPCFLLMLP